MTSLPTKTYRRVSQWCSIQAISSRSCKICAGTPPKQMAFPSTFLLDKDRKIFFAKISKTHGGRTTAAEIGEALRAYSRL